MGQREIVREDIGRVSNVLRNSNAMNNRTEIGECSTKYTSEMEPLLEREEDRVSHPVNGDNYQTSGFLQHINVNSV